jgi:hypothetical protein
MTVTRKQIHNALGRLLERYEKRYSHWAYQSAVSFYFRLSQLVLWTLPHPKYLLFFVEEQLPCLFARFPEIWVTERRRKQKMFGNTREPSFTSILKAITRFSKFVSTMEMKIDSKQKAVA